MGKFKSTIAMFCLIIFAGWLISSLAYYGFTMDEKFWVSLPFFDADRVRQYISSIPNTSIVHTQFNFHVVAPGVWRSSQPSMESILRLNKYRLKTIINLRWNKSVHAWESKLASQLGIDYYNFPMRATTRQEDARLNTILNIIKDPANHPVLIHCKAGKDRTGLVVALYKTRILGYPFEDAYREMLMYGYAEKNIPVILQTVREFKLDQ